jgi:hypothetical protein
VTSNHFKGEASLLEVGKCNENVWTDNPIRRDGSMDGLKAQATRSRGDFILLPERLI